MITPRSLTSAGIVATCFLLAIMALPSHAAEPSLQIRSSAIRADGLVQAIVAVEGLPAGARLGATDVEVADSGGTVRDLEVSTMTARSLSVALVIDTSADTAGRPILSAITAADRFVASLPIGTTISLITTGEPTRVVQAPTTDVDAVRSALSGLQAVGGATLYDGLKLVAGTLASAPGQRNAIIISNGRDTTSSVKMLDGVRALLAAKVTTTVVGLATTDFGGNDGSITIARASGGTLVKVTASTGLARALTTVAETLSSQYAVSYRVDRTSAAQFDLTIGLVGQSAKDVVTLLAPATAIRNGRKPLPSPLLPTEPWFAPFAEPVGLTVGLFAVFFAGLLLFAPVLLPSNEREASRSLRKALQRPRKEAAHGDLLEGVIASSVGRAALDLMAKSMPRGASVAKLQMALVRSGWPLRAAEFRVIQTGAVIGATLFGSILLQKWWLALAMGVIAAAIPRMLLKRRIESRNKAFLAQLPSALDILSSSLQAGLSFMQALDGLVKELPNPAAEEFGRIISESRLGLPLETSLEASAERIDSLDYSWVVMAIVIQRRTGGNLAHLMRTVATTLRERAQVRQQIRVLSSEGRLSAVILIVLPFVLSGYIMVVNPGYIGKLFEVRIGQMMVLGALTLMAVGVAWMRKIIRIDI